MHVGVSYCALFGYLYIYIYKKCLNIQSYNGRIGDVLMVDIAYRSTV